MERELSSREIIAAGKSCETYQAWEQARSFAWAIYGPRAMRLTFSQTAFLEDDHRLRTVQALAFDSNSKLLPYDFATTWWGRVAGEKPIAGRSGAKSLARRDIARGLGDSLPDVARVALQATAEELLGVETLRTWADTGDSETLTWMFDFAAPPPLPAGAIVDALDGVSAPLSRDEIAAAGAEHAAHQRWRDVREYVWSLYGERAVLAEVIAFSRYNDNTYDREMRLNVLDSDAQRLAYDLRGPWWARFALAESDIAAYEAEHGPDSPVDTEFDGDFYGGPPAEAPREVERMATTLLGAENITTFYSWDTDSQTYDLTQPPALRYPRLWEVLED